LLEGGSNRRHSRQYGGRRISVFWPAGYLQFIAVYYRIEIKEYQEEFKGNLAAIPLNPVSVCLMDISTGGWKE